MGRALCAAIAALLVVAAAPAPAPAELWSPQERAAVLAALAADEALPPSGRSDAALRDALLASAKKRLGLRLSPPQVDDLWALKPAPRDVAQELATAEAQGKIATWLQSLDPPGPEYPALAAERRRYRTIAGAGGWSALAGSAPLRPGDPPSPLVPSLRERLRIEGYDVGSASDEQTYDAALQAAVSLFQRRHGLDEDAVIGPATRAALDVPAAERVAQLDANLERLRWLPHDLPPRRVEVDTGRAELHVFEAGRSVLAMRVVVGDPRHKTPMFASQLRAVVFNPPWNVPASIAKAEILPKAARDPGYLARNHFVRTPAGLQQRPGPDSALGQLKFDLESPFGVYLHDTPSRAAFARSVRTLSHGCMRLAAPRELAEWLMAPQGWSRADIDSTIATAATSRVALKTAVPLYVVHRTAVIGDDGWAVFGNDVYGWDAKLTRALGGQGVAATTARLASECSGSSPSTGTRVRSG